VTPSNTATPSRTPSITPSRTASVTPSNTATPSVTPSRTPSITPSTSCICNTPTITSITNAGGGQISIAFSLPSCGGCTATNIQYSTDNVNWANSNTGGCTSPRVVTPPYSAPFYVRIQQVGACGTSAYSAGYYYNPPSATPSVTPSITPSKTPSVTPSPSVATYTISFYGDQYTPATGNGWTIVYSTDCVNWSDIYSAMYCPTNNGCAYAGYIDNIAYNTTLYIAVVDCAFGIGNGISFDLSSNTDACPDTNNFSFCESTDGSCSGSPYSFTVTQNIDLAITVSVSKFGYGYCF
jgi:hypothetical protein